MKPHSVRLILASRSPRRRELLSEAGYNFEIVEPDENVESMPADSFSANLGTAQIAGCSRESPEQLVARLSRQKAADVAARVESGLVLGCDTVAECDGRILGKPADEDDARKMLETLSGREHRVLSGLCLWPAPNGEPRVRVEVTRLRMDRLTSAQVDDYLASGLWVGKAGGFGYQDRQGWLHIVAGSESNVVGLPLELLAEMLAAIRAALPSPSASSTP